MRKPDVKRASVGILASGGVYGGVFTLFKHFGIPDEVCRFFAATIAALVMAAGFLPKKDKP